jgi:iron complex transport system permease protein
MPKNFVLFSGLALLLFGLCLWHLHAGQLSIGIGDFWSAVVDGGNSTEELIAREFRIPRMLTAVIAGGGLAVAGMIMQTLFNNPLAGPYVLGISSGSSLFVALCTMTGIPFLQSNMGLVGGAFSGALIFGAIILFFSFFIRSSVSLLLVGLMLGSFTGSLISILEATSTASELKSFTMWTMGSLQNVQFSDLTVLIALFIPAVSLLFLLTKPLNVLLLGDKEAQQLGLNMQVVRVACISVTALFTGLITAFCGPIAFVGLAVPNMSRLLFRTQNHRILLPANLLIGASFIILGDILIQLLESSIILPINVFTSLLGAPIVIFIILKRMK